MEREGSVMAPHWPAMDREALFDPREGNRIRRGLVPGGAAIP
jgi:hypothetical protein